MKEYREIQYTDLMALIDVKDFSVEEALNHTGQLIDQASDRLDASGLRKANNWCRCLLLRKLGSNQAATIYYFISNIWAGLQQIRHTRDPQSRWSWRQFEIERKIYYLRKAISDVGFAALDDVRKCQIYTNIAGSLNTLGRFVEASEYWSLALEIDSEFTMAHGNRGIGRLSYARALYDYGHSGIFLFSAHSDLSQSIKQRKEKQHAVEPEAIRYFAQQMREIETVVDIEAIRAEFVSKGYKVGDTTEEKAYRVWCLKNRLFLNPLNDLVQESIAAQDILTLPNLVTNIHEPPVLIGLFNQLKQEFVSARWMYYLGIQNSEPHFSDKDVLLYNTLDYPTLSLSVEHVKSAYKYSYSLFDKVAFFANYYFDLNVAKSRVSFRTIWYQSDNHKLKHQFKEYENWPLRGLFSLSKDLFDKSQKNVVEPDAQALHELRINLEHRYVKVHEYDLNGYKNTSVEDPFFDHLAYSISRKSLEAKTLKLLKLVRAAMIYLSLAVQAEELHRQKKRGEGQSVTIYLDKWEDDWKW